MPTIPRRSVVEALGRWLGFACLISFMTGCPEKKSESDDTGQGEGTDSTTESRGTDQTGTGASTATTSDDGPVDSDSNGVPPDTQTNSEEIPPTDSGTVSQDTQTTSAATTDTFIEPSDTSTDTATVTALPSDTESESSPTGGRFTGNEPLCGAPLAIELTATRAQLESQFEAEWFEGYDAFVSSYLDGDNQPNPLEALEILQIASIEEDNVYPFCIAAIDALAYAPENAYLLNSAAVCLLRLGQIDPTGDVLDCAYESDPSLYLTWNNGAVWYAMQSRISEAIAAKMEALALMPQNGQTAWNGMEFAANNGDDTSAQAFRDQLPANYPLTNGDGSVGGDGPARTALCCSCNDTFYDDVTVCVSECDVSLACFTAICTPDVACCGGNSPFTVGIQICVPPGGLQACIGLDSGGTLSVSVQAGIGNWFQAGVSGKLSFGDSGVTAGVSVYGAVGGSVGGGIELDPATGQVASTFSAFAPVGPVAIGVSLGLPSGSNWLLALLCK